MSNCGIDANNTNVTITDSWWGAPTGPGAEPADDACDELTGSIPSFADKPIKVKPKPIR